MSARIVLITHGSTLSLRRGDFPADEHLDEAGRQLARAHALSVHSATLLLTAPARSSRETAELLGLAAQPEPALDDWDLGSWRGRTLDSVDPADLSAWLSKATARPHGGESLAELIQRVDGWLSLVAEGRMTAVVSAPVARALIVSALGIGPDAFWRIDLAPLTAAVLSQSGSRWNLRSSGQPLDSLPALNRSDRLGA
jgi:broad specificity phosphatase PhoE